MWLTANHKCGWYLTLSVASCGWQPNIPSGILEHNDLMLKHAVNYYQNLFGHEANYGVSLGENFREEGEKVSATENELLEAPFSEEEIKIPMLMGP